MERDFFVRIAAVAGFVLVLLGAMGARALGAGADEPGAAPTRTEWASREGRFDTETGATSAALVAADTRRPVRLDVDVTYAVGGVDLGVTLINAGPAAVRFDDGVAVPVRFTGTRPDGSSVDVEIVVRDGGLRVLGPGEQATTVRHDVPFPARGSFSYTGLVTYR